MEAWFAFFSHNLLPQRGSWGGRLPSSGTGLISTLFSSSVLNNKSETSKKKNCSESFFSLITWMHVLLLLVLFLFCFVSFFISWIWIAICCTASFSFTIIWGELSLSTEPLLCVCYICSANTCRFIPDRFQVPSTQSSYFVLTLGSVDAKSVAPLLPFNNVRWAVYCGNQSCGNLGSISNCISCWFFGFFFILWELCFWKVKQCYWSPVIFEPNAISHIFIWLAFVQEDSFSKYSICRIDSTACALFIAITVKSQICTEHPTNHFCESTSRIKNIYSLLH